VPAPGDVGHDEVRLGRGVELALRLVLADGEAQRLLDGRLQSVVQLVDAKLQPFVFMHQRIADQHPGHATIFLREREQHRNQAFELLQPARLLGADLVRQREDRLLDELDQPFEHLCLAREMSVERRLGDIEPGRECRCGDLLRRGPLEHLGQVLQDLLLSFPRSAERHPVSLPIPFLSAERGGRGW